MGFRFRKQIKIAPGVKLNINKKSVSVSVGGKGVTNTFSTTGKTTTTVGIPGTGISYSTTEKIEKSTITEPNKKIPPVCDLNHLDENGELPVGWLYANREFTREIRDNYDYFLKEYISAKNEEKGIRVVRSTLKSLIIFMEDTEKICAAKGECFVEWSKLIVCNPAAMESYRKDLQRIEDNFEDLIKKENLLDWLIPELLKIVKENPGIYQPDIYKMFDVALKPEVSNQLYLLYDKDFITREKSGRSYKLYMKQEKAEE